MRTSLTASLRTSLGAGGEFSLRGIALGALITVIFTAANVYFGLKAGLTIASSIPAAVISMAALRAIGGSTILENNTVQTLASAAGTLSCVFASLPALVMVGAWQGFPFLETAILCAAGGMTGVLFTIPLRRALVAESDLPYPEGVACAEVLRVSSSEGSASGARALAEGGIVAAVFSFLSGGLRLIPDGVSGTTVLGGGIFRLEAGYSLALVATGTLVGIGGGIAMLIGVAIAWGVAVPLLSLGAQAGAPAALAESLWLHRVRFMGAGTIAVAAIWTLASLAGPVARGLRGAFSAAQAQGEAETERDLPPRMILSLGIALIAVLAALFTAFLWPRAPHGAIPVLTLFGAAAVALLGFLVAGACGYMAGLIGSSSSPLSGIAIVAILILSALLLGLERIALVSLPAGGQSLAVAFSLFVLSAIVASSAISNDNLQDLKTGRLVGASPWIQELALLLGCAIGALVIPPVLNLLYQAYGFAGAMPRPGMDPAHALAAPQPALMAAIATGMFGGGLDWPMIETGAALGVAIIALDLILRRKGRALPPLAVGMGIYLPASISMTVGFGAVLGWLLRRGRKSAEGDIGTLLASGLIVGESLMGVLLAALAGATGRTDSLSIGSGEGPFAAAAGAILFALVLVWFARRIRAPGQETG